MKNTLTEQTSLCLITTVVPHWAYKGGKKPVVIDGEEPVIPEIEEKQTVQRVTSLMSAMPAITHKDENEHSLLLGGEEEEKRKEKEQQQV
ncbi:cleft lip and palate transmembrane protein 1 protein, partial [Cystoisospora suis]